MFPSAKWNLLALEVRRRVREWEIDLAADTSKEKSRKSSPADIDFTLVRPTGFSWHTAVVIQFNLQGENYSHRTPRNWLASSSDWQVHEETSK